MLCFLSAVCLLVCLQNNSKTYIVKVSLKYSFTTSSNCLHSILYKQPHALGVIVSKGWKRTEIWILDLKAKK